MITTNVPNIANRSDSLLRTKPGDSMRRSHHISVNACRRCDIQLRPAQAAVARPMTPTDARASIAEFIKLEQLLTQRAGHRGPDVVVDRVQQLRPPRQHEPDDRETDHQQRE